MEKLRPSNEMADGKAMVDPSPLIIVMGRASPWDRLTLDPLLLASAPENEASPKKSNGRSRRRDVLGSSSTHSADDNDDE